MTFQPNLCFIKSGVVERKDLEVKVFVLPQRDYFAAIALMDFEQDADPAVLSDLTVHRNGNDVASHRLDTSRDLDM